MVLNDSKRLYSSSEKAVGKFVFVSVMGVCTINDHFQINAS